MKTFAFNSMAFRRLVCSALGTTTQLQPRIKSLLAVVIFIVPLYYLLFQSTMHNEARYTVAMQYFLFIFAATVWVLLGVAVGRGLQRIARWRLTTDMNAR